MNLSEEIRALSWKQPYASLMLHGKIETRTWQTNYRGKVLICASKQPYSSEQILEISGSINWVMILPHDYNELFKLCGKAIAIGDLVDCRAMKKNDEEACFVEYESNLFCHVYENVQPIEPFDWKGSQGWKILNVKQKQMIRLLKDSTQ